MSVKLQIQLVKSFHVLFGCSFDHFRKNVTQFDHLLFCAILNSQFRSKSLQDTAYTVGLGDDSIIEIRDKSPSVGNVGN